MLNPQTLVAIIGFAASAGSLYTELSTALVDECCNTKRDKRQSCFIVDSACTEVFFRLFTNCLRHPLPEFQRL